MNHDDLYLRILLRVAFSQPGSFNIVIHDFGQDQDNPGVPLNPFF